MSIIILNPQKCQTASTTSASSRGAPSESVAATRSRSYSINTAALEFLIESWPLVQKRVTAKDDKIDSEISHL